MFLCCVKQTLQRISLPLAGVAAAKRWSRRRRHRALDGTAVCAIWCWQELRLLANLAEVLEDVDCFFTPIAWKVDAEEIASVIGLVSCGLKVLFTDANIEPLGVKSLVGSGWLVTLLQW